MSFQDVVENCGKGVDAAGVVVVVVGGLAALIIFVLQLRTQPFAAAFSGLRHGLARAILLGLEFLVAGDLVRKVAVRPTFTTVGVLAVIVVIRTFLSLSMQLEIEGRFPWQPRRPAVSASREAPSRESG
ncbi:MAG: DUF1622 domain-containing protein [Dehalococcoidia bacterium]|nr:DUF1622 domain-containing protein [Dehalococcoidia bacterium]